MVNKLHDDFIHPIELNLLNLTEKTLPYYKKLNFVPNYITTLSIIADIIAMYFLYYGKVNMAALFHSMSYVFDCTDGQYARKYNMITPFGDYYDHISDIFGIIGIFTIIYLRYDINKKWLIPSMIILGITFIKCMTYIGYQERHKKITRKTYTESYSLEVTDYLTNNETNTKDVNEQLHKHKFWSCTMFQILLIIFIISLQFQAKLKI